MFLAPFLERLPLTTGARKIRWLRQERPRNCVQTVVAMAVGASVADVEAVARTEDTLDIPATMTLLAHYGVFCRPISAQLVADFWPMYYRQGGGRRLRGLGFASPNPAHGREVGHAYFLYGPRLYDPATGITEALDEPHLRQLDWLVLFPETQVDRSRGRATNPAPRPATA